MTNERTKLARTNRTGTNGNQSGGEGLEPRKSLEKPGTAPIQATHQSGDHRVGEALTKMVRPSRPRGSGTPGGERPESRQGGLRRGGLKPGKQRDHRGKGLMDPGNDPRENGRKNPTPEVRKSRKNARWAWKTRDPRRSLARRVTGDVRPPRRHHGPHWKCSPRHADAGFFRESSLHSDQRWTGRSRPIPGGPLRPPVMAKRKCIPRAKSEKFLQIVRSSLKFMIFSGFGPCRRRSGPITNLVVPQNHRKMTAPSISVWGCLFVRGPRA